MQHLGLLNYKSLEKKFYVHAELSLSTVRMAWGLSKFRLHEEN